MQEKIASSALGRLAGVLRKALYRDVTPASVLGHELGHVASQRALPTPLRQIRQAFPLLRPLAEAAAVRSSKPMLGQAAAALPGQITELDAVRRALKAIKRTSSRQQYAASRRALGYRAGLRGMGDVEKVVASGGPASTSAGGTAIPDLVPPWFLHPVRSAQSREKLLGPLGRNRLKRALLKGHARGAGVEYRESPPSLLAALLGKKKGAPPFSIGRTAYVPMHPAPDWGGGSALHKALRKMELKTKKKDWRDVTLAAAHSPFVTLGLALSAGGPISPTIAQTAIRALGASRLPAVSPLRVLQ